MDAILTWLEDHDKLAGWAQFLGAILALMLTYVTAFAPGWRRKRQLHSAAKRLLANGYEVIESYHRTSAHFLPFPQSIRLASLTMSGVIEEIGRFPIFELDNHVHSRSLPRLIMTMRLVLSTVKLELDTAADNLDGREATEEEHQHLRSSLGERLEFARTLITGGELKRPEWTS